MRLRGLCEPGRELGDASTVMMGRNKLESLFQAPARCEMEKFHRNETVGCPKC